MTGGASVLAVRSGNSPIDEHRGLLAGLGVAAVVAGLVHLGVGWAPAYRGYAHLLVLGLVFGLLGAGEVVQRAGAGWPAVALGVPAAGLAWLGGVWMGAPAVRLGVVAYLERLARQPTADIGEATSLLGSPESPVALFGLLLLVARPAMGWTIVAVAREHRPGWLALSAYAWVFLALSLVRLRFAGQLAVFVAAFAAVSVGWLALVDAGSDAGLERPPLDWLAGRLAALTVDHPVRTGVGWCSWSCSSSAWASRRSR